MKKIVLTSFTILCLLSTVFQMGLSFDIRTVKASGTIYIEADGNIDPPTANITTADNVTYYFTENNFDEIVVERDNIVIDGAGYMLQGNGTGRGIDLTNRSNVTIENMKIKAFIYGIWLEGSLNNNIYGNHITENNKYAIWLWYSYNNSIRANAIVANNEYGIGLGRSSLTNSVSENNIENNYIGIGLGSSFNNSIYHNNFVDNRVLRHILNSRNVWDDGYPSGGNYWSGYTGVDRYSGPYQNETSSDGIGDTPYVIYENNIDNYPLMRLYVSPDMQLLYWRLLANHIELQSKYDTLVALQAELFEDLQSSQSKYGSLTNELNIIRNIVYALLTTTIIFIATTVYFAMRKPRIQP